MKIRFILTSLLFATASSAFAQQAERDFAFENYRRYYQEAAEYNQDSNKLEAVKKMRDYFHNHPYRLQPTSNLEQVQNFLKQLGEDGTFADMNPTERDFEKNNAYQKGFENTTGDVVGIFIASAYERLFQIASAIRLARLQMTKPCRRKFRKPSCTMAKSKCVVPTTNHVSMLRALPFLRLRSTSTLLCWIRWTRQNGERQHPC